MFSKAAAKATTFAITDINLYIPVITLPTQDNLKLLKQLESGFKRINQNYQEKDKTSRKRK